ncbi:MAG: antitoxin family protein [Elainellaceae cyanobacterium]
MQLTIQAIYEEGVLRPTHPIELPDGTQVLIVITTPEPISVSDSAGILAEIASLPQTSPTQEFSNRNHDEQLYSAEANP